MYVCTYVLCIHAYMIGGSLTHGRLLPNTYSREYYSVGVYLQLLQINTYILVGRSLRGH